MSTFQVLICDINQINPHPNAHSLDIVRVCGSWDIIARKNQYKVGDLVIFVPPNSILPQELEYKLFPPDSKITLKKHRVRAIKIRNVISPGMLIDIDVVREQLGSQWANGDNVAEKLGITKYEPPAWDLPANMGVKTGKKKKDNTSFIKYTDIENFKYYDRLFQDNEEVYLSTKLHGTSARFGWFKTEANTWYKKVLKFCRVLPEWEFCWGSRNVQIQNKFYHKGFYDEDVYSKMVKQYDLKNRIPKGYAIYGEIVGPGIQKGYTYDLPEGEHKLYVYDILHEGKWLDYEQFVSKVDEFKLERVNECYVGPYDEAKILSYLELYPFKSKEINEGLVLKPKLETTCSIGRKILKIINPNYYLQDTTEFQ